MIFCVMLFCVSVIALFSVKVIAVASKQSMHTVVSDLERASELHQDKPMVRRMLGDAYMRNGQINKAIDTYRNALDQM